LVWVAEECDSSDSSDSDGDDAAFAWGEAVRALGVVIHGRFSGSAV